MTTLKKILGVSAVAAFAVVPSVSAASFSDTKGHWVAEFLDTAIEAGVIDTSKSTFRPDENISRAALVKIVANYDNGGENPTAGDYTDVAGFSDNSADAWFYHHVNYAAENGIIDGSKETFRPGSAITRAEALKVILEALSVPSDSTKANPFSDVSSDAWYAEYVTTAYNSCIVNGATKFNPNNTITRAAAVKIFVTSMNPGCDVEETPTVTETATTTETETAEITVSTSGDATSTTTGTTDAIIEVVVNNTINTGSVPMGGSNIELLALDITASDVEDVKISGLTAYHTGHGDERDIDSIGVFDGYNQAGGSKSFSGDDDMATLNLGSEEIVIKAGETKTIFVKAQIIAPVCADNTGAEVPCEGNNLDIVVAPAFAVGHGVQILTAEGIQAYGVETGGKVAVSGSFPIAGPQREIANFSVGGLAVSYENIDNETIEVGTTKAKLAHLKVEANGVEDVWLKNLTVELNGVDDGNIANLFVEIDEKRASDVVATSDSDVVTFDFTQVDPRGVLIEDSSSEHLDIRGDLTSSIDDFDAGNSISIDDVESDVIAIGARHGFDVNKTISGDVQEFTLEGGDFEITMEGEVADIPSDKDGVVLGTVTLENFGSQLEVQKNFALNIETNNAAGLNDVSLYSPELDRDIFGPADLTLISGNLYAVNFNDTYVVNAGTKLVLEVRADTTSSAVENDTFKASLPIEAGMAHGGPDLDDATAVTLKPSAGTTVSANLMTVLEPGVTFAGKSLSNDNIVEGASDLVVWEGTVRANEAEDIRVTRIGFKNDGDALVSDVNGYDLYAVVDGVETELENNADAEATGVEFSFSDLTNSGLTIEAGQEIGLVLKVNIASEIVAGGTIQVSLVEAQTLAKDEDSDFLDAGTGTISSGATYTLVDTGLATVALDSNTPNAAIAVAGETLPVALFKLEATDESAKFNDLQFQVNDSLYVSDSTSSVDSLSLYVEGELVDTASVTDEDDDFTTAPTALFEGVNIVVPEGDDVYLEVRATIDEMSENTQDTAQSGSVISVDLVASSNEGTEVVGAQSGTEISVATVSGASDFLVLNNKVLAAEVALSNTVLADSALGKEVLKFTLEQKGDEEAYLTKLTPEVADANSRITALKLYESGKLLAVSATAGSAAVAQVDTVTVSGVHEKGEVYSVVVNGVTYSAVALVTDSVTTYSTAKTSAQIATELAALVNADATAVVTADATAADGTFTLTADVAGTAFTTSTSVVEGALEQRDTVTINLSGAFGTNDTLTVVLGDADNTDLTDNPTCVITAQDTDSTTNDLLAKVTTCFNTPTMVDAVPANDVPDANNTDGITSHHIPVAGTITAQKENPVDADSYVQISAVAAGDSVTVANSSSTGATLIVAAANSQEDIARDGTQAIANVATTGNATAIVAGELVIGSCGTETCDTSTAGGKVAVNDGGTYVIKAVISGVTADETISVELAINGNNDDSITWSDYGTTGANGTSVQWIDLGDSSDTSISGALSN